MATPRRLNDRKIPDFWEDKPEFWFHIFDSHLAHFNPTEQRCFEALLPLLTPAARARVHPVIRNPGSQPYTKARQALLRHFGRTPRQLAREFREMRSLGDRLPSEMLDHLRGLANDITLLQEVVLLDMLPANARDAALHHHDIDEMAAAADLVVLENRAAAVPLSDVSVSSMTLLDSSEITACSSVDGPVVAAISRDKRPPLRKTDNLCAIHARWGKEAYRCSSPRTCKMRTMIRPRPAQASSASGNGSAGGPQ